MTVSSHSSGAGSRLRLRVAVAAAAIVFFLGLGVSTVFRAGPYPVGGSESAGKSLTRWEKRMGFSLDKSGRKVWGSKVHRTDFTVYTAAGQAVRDHTDIYQAHNIRGWNYLYPPPFEVLMV